MPMRHSIHCLLLASLIGSSNHKSAIADIVTFASGENQFQIEFVPIKHTSNRADTLGNPNPVGAVRYNYYMGKYEISRSAVTRALSQPPVHQCTAAGADRAVCRR